MISSLALAKICGVSQGTVDRALHNRPGISVKTRELILSEAVRHGYRPNPAARELITGKNSGVGAVAPPGGGVFIMDLLSALNQKLASAGRKLSVSFASDEEDVCACLADFSARRHSGAVIFPPSSKTVVPSALHGGMPVVSLLNVCSGENVVNIHPDELKTGADAVRYFLSAGRRRIIHLTYKRPEFDAVVKRASGYGDETRKNGLESRVLSGFDEAGLLSAVREFRADALFCHNDWMALRALRALEKAGVKVPDDVSILGVDNSPSFVELCPLITTMEYPLDWLAESAAAVIDGRTPSPPPAFKIVRRET